MASKQIEVLHWLEEVLGKSEIPNFERSSSNFEKLHLLMTQYKEACENAHLINDYNKNVEDSYESYYYQISNNLKDLGITSNFLDPEEQKCLKSLGTLSFHLGLQSASPANVMLAINSIEEENSELEESLRKERLTAQKLFKLTKTVGQNLDEIKKVSESAEKAFNDKEEECLKEKKRAQFNEEKSKKYQSDINMLKNKLDVAGFSDNISLEAVSQKIKDCSIKKKELERKKEIIESYTLPPDMTLAVLKVEELKKILAETMKNISQAYVNQK